MIWLALASIPWMTWLSRMHGGGKPKLPLGLDAWLLCLPFFIFWPQIQYWTILAYLCGVLGVRSGHGRFFHYNLPFEVGSKPERVEPLIPDSWLVYWQKFSGMLLTGLSVTLALSIALMFHQEYLPAMVLLLSAAAKSVAYLTRRTETSEYLRGAFLGLGVFVAYVLI